MIIKGFAITDRGSEKPLNDDRVILGNSVLSAGCVEYSGNGPVFAAVFDGVSYGGHGAEASGVATASFADYCERVRRAGSRGDLYDETLEEVFDGIQEELLAYCQGIGSSEPVATTVSGIKVNELGQIVGFYAGDSRVYRYRGGMLIQMTTDHTVVQSLVENGADDCVIDQAEESSGHIITKALGVPSKTDTVVDIENFGEMLPGDIYLGCTDGVSGFLDRGLIKRVLSQNAPLEVTARTIMDMALHNGSYDNLSLFLLARGGDSPIEDDVILDRTEIGPEKEPAQHIADDSSSSRVFYERPESQEVSRG